MSKLKTVKNSASVSEYIATIEHPGRRADSQRLQGLFREWTGEDAAMWGDSIVGFGSYHYKSDLSSQEGDWPLTGFSARKQSITIYIMPGFDDYADQLAILGKHKTSVSCLYIKRLSDVDLAVLKSIIVDASARMRDQNTSL